SPQFAAPVAVLPDETLQRFEAWRLLVAIHQREDVLEDVGETGRLILFTQERHGFLTVGRILMAREVLRRVHPGIGKQNLGHEFDRRRGPFDVEEKRPNLECCESDGHSEGHDTSRGTNVGPKHTGWKLASTPLFV